ncbi:hypothetical protein Ae263Ps1_6363 [Pseudonocardia sp. Ae263_Ps1]|nr:hypothetical protein Ae263Ps1_6363 [Pseudonocardia sp. Ae263_Ps1]
MWAVVDWSIATPSRWRRVSVGAAVAAQGQVRQAPQDLCII